MEGVVLYRGRVYVPDNPQLHHDLVHVHHGAAVAGDPGEKATKPWGGVNVILCGDFHQFKPVVQKKSTPLYWPVHSLIDNEEE